MNYGVMNPLKKKKKLSSSPHRNRNFFSKNPILIKEIIRRIIKDLQDFDVLIRIMHNKKLNPVPIY